MKPPTNVRPEQGLRRITLRSCGLEPLMRYVHRDAAIGLRKNANGLAYVVLECERVQAVVTQIELGNHWLHRTKVRL